MLLGAAMKYLFTVLCLMVSVPGTSLAQRVESPTAALARLNDASEMFFDRRTARLNLTRPLDDPNVEQVMFVFSAFTYGDVGVTIFLERRPELKGHDPIVTLSASWIDSRKNTYETQGDVDRFSLVIDSYDTEISAEDFNAIVQHLSESGFYSEPAETESALEPDFVCLDGASYFIESRLADRNHLIARHSCYLEYSVSGKHAAPLIKLARKKFPALRGTLNEVVDRVTGE